MTTNIKKLVKELIVEQIEIDREQIENAILELDITDMVQSAVEEKLPDAIAAMVDDVLDEAVDEAITATLY